MHKKEGLLLHKKGKLEIKSKASLKTSKTPSLAYTPGIAEVIKEISKNKILPDILDKNIVKNYPPKVNIRHHFLQDFRYQEYRAPQNRNTPNHHSG